MVKDEGGQCGGDAPVAEEMSDLDLEMQKVSTRLSTGVRPVDRLADILDRRIAHCRDPHNMPKPGIATERSSRAIFYVKSGPEPVVNARLGKSARGRSSTRSACAGR